MPFYRITVYAQDKGSIDMGRVEQNKQLKLHKLMDSAFHLFTSKGISRTSISDIAGQAGLAKGTFYLYFHDKYDLQQKLIADRASKMIRHALSCSDFSQYDDPEDKVIAFIDAILDQFQEDKALLRFINKRLSWGVFARAMDQADPGVLGEFADILPYKMSEKEMEIAVYTIIEMVGTACYDVILEVEPLPYEEYKPYLHRSIRALLRSFVENKTSEE